MPYVNLGCGNRFHPDWINIDIASSSAHVIVHDLGRGIPLPDASCEVVYLSHVLEHFRRANALALVRECYRVMRPGGILRVAVPDLEKICQLYLTKLQAVLSGDSSSIKDYEWVMLEMYDQAVRERGGGEMLSYLHQYPLPNEAFVYERIGEEGRSIARSIKSQAIQQFAVSGWRIRLRRLVSRVRICLTRLLVLVSMGRKGVMALDIGMFRLAGEVHHWMYDRYSLKELLLTSGFRDPIQQTASTSRIQNWSSFDLDTLPDGTVYKPDSLFMEATKPTEI